MTPSKPRKQYTPEFKAQAIDICSRRIAGWALANHMMRAELVTDALKQALGTRLASSSPPIVGANTAAVRTAKSWKKRTSSRVCPPNAVSLVLKNQKIEPQMKRMKTQSLSVFFICVHLSSSAVKNS